MSKSLWKLKKKNWKSLPNIPVWWRIIRISSRGYVTWSPDTASHFICCNFAKVKIWFKLLPLLGPQFIFYIRPTSYIQKHLIRNWLLCNKILIWLCYLIQHRTSSQKFYKIMNLAHYTITFWPEIYIQCDIINTENFMRTFWRLIAKRLKPSMR